MPFDFSQVETFLSCPEKYKLKYLDGLKKVKEDVYSQPKLFGQAFHDGMKAYYLRQGLEAAKASFLATYPAVLESKEVLYTPANGLKLVESYMNYADPIEQEWEVLAVEQVIEFELAPGVPWIVKPDLIVRNVGGIWAMDHKTTTKSLRSMDYWRGWENHGQITSQTLGVKSVYGQCSGVIINGIHIGYRKNMYKGEPAGFNWDFQRNPFNRTPEQIEDWTKRTILTIQRLKATVKSGAWEKHDTMCLYCEFLDLCASTDNPGVREVLYETDDPLAYLKET